MMAITHAAISMAGVALLIPNSTDPHTMLAALIGSQIPDIDTTSSLIGRVCYPLARFIEERWRHRTVTHSILMTIVVAVLSAPIAYYFNWRWSAAVVLGHFLSICADTATKSGAALFFPNPVMCVLGRNPNNRISTGSTAEYWVLAIATILICFGVWLNDQGGMQLWVSDIFSLPQAVEQIYNENGSTNHVFIDVQGVRTTDRSPINQRFFIVAQKQKGYIGQDAIGLYWIDDFGDIQPKRQTAEVGNGAITQLQAIDFDDVDLGGTLKDLAASHPNSAIYLSGNFIVDAPEYIQAYSPPGQHKYIQAQGSFIILDHCPVQQAITLLPDQFAVGRITAKIITPKPELL
ncbi:MAG: metal-dependent hydrolase [Cyanobacteria bacterium J06592_8]